jgi:hypothetical protein
MGCVADVHQSVPHDDLGSYDGGDPEVQATRQVTGALRRPRRGIRARRGTSSKGAAYRLMTARQPPARSDREPARLEMAKEVPRDFSSKPATSRPNKES